MAHVKLVQRGEKGTAVYLVDGAVGRGQANRRDDVLLVQFFLRALAGVKAAGIGDTYQVPGAMPLFVDGICGAQTMATISRFQNVLKAQTKDNSLLDGVVHPAGSSMFGAWTAAVMTILRLNMEYRFTFGDNQLLRIDTDPLFPRQLTERFFLTA
jgi:hypothetical protein